MRMNISSAEIYEKGEWKSAKSAVRYADEDVIDPVRLLWQVIDASESEDEKDEAPNKKHATDKKRKLVTRNFWSRKRSTATMGV